jgi:hypothetical protein
MGGMKMAMEILTSVGFALIILLFLIPSILGALILYCLRRQKEPHEEQGEENVDEALRRALGLKSDPPGVSEDLRQVTAAIRDLIAAKKKRPETIDEKYAHWCRDRDEIISLRRENKKLSDENDDLSFQLTMTNRRLQDFEQKKAREAGIKKVDCYKGVSIEPVSVGSLEEEDDE